MLHRLSAAPRALLPTLLCALLASAVGGCKMLSAGAYLVEGPPDVPAVHELDASRPTVLFMDDRKSELSTRLRRTIAETAEEEMLKKGVVKEGKLISWRSAQRATAGESSDELVSIVEVGRRVDAEVVIYVSVSSFSLTGSDGGIAPNARLDVKVLDAAENKRLFPQSDDPYELEVQMPQSASDPPSNRSEARALSKSVAAYTGVELARMFYTYEKQGMDTGLGR